MPDNNTKTKYIPFSDPEEFLYHYGSSFEHPKETLDFSYRFLDGIWIRGKHDKNLYQVISISKGGVFIGGIDYKIYWSYLHINFEFLDGSPCGKESKDE